MDLLVALAELPLQIRGFGPVKEKNAEDAARTRDEILAQLKAGGAPVLQAAE
jgi:indolepyruvate ferredoxin oxidoreductase